MRLYYFVPFVFALLVNVVIGLDDDTLPTTYRRFSALERRARQHQEAAAALIKREDFTCGPGRPCGNGACCGKDGWCGYGPTYCGDGCTSNCDAHAECGQYAVPKDKTCPLNTCCSEFGFCDTTKDFCTGKCQSNCVEHPKPPGGGGSGKTLAKVIGYYEVWNDRSKCHQTKASDLPVDGLTHLNYAFAYIDPTSFQITTMDAATPAQTLEDVSTLKLSKPDLQLYVSLGGWTFSDNGTATQPVFGNIARSSANRQKFATNLLKFLDTYGYDGVDLDWEYPGAPDRGGKEDDTKNYVLLVEALRKAFDASGRKLGLTFTAPSSFWYLRWFDLPGMIKYVDWINIMSYDLHGVWDSSNPIGSIVQGHTNLTEIKLAAELFWRVKIPPSKLALGFGFYGRAFTLADPGCTHPGCPFAGGAKPGVCTGTSGYLAHYEIQDIISKNQKRGLTPVYDKEAAVKYMTWDDNQWISFDDADTFNDKIKWADSVGFSGSLIWASDLDDYQFTAHKALTGKTSLKTALALVNKKRVTVNEIDASLGNNCYKEPNRFVQSCDKGYVKVGSDWDGDKCKNTDDSLCGRIICCPQTAGMTDCMWRGSGGDCNGQCHPGEVKVGGSSWGGKPGESSPTSRCSRGGKAFCCKASQFPSLTESCRWTDHCWNTGCDDDEEDVAYAWNRWGSATIFCHGYHYCCKKNRPIPLKACHWVGKGDCADNTCAKSEVVLWTDNFGGTDGSGACNWWRKKSLCCTPNEDALEEDVCDYNVCKDEPDACNDGLEDTSFARRRDGSLEARDNKPGLPRTINLKMAARALTWKSRPYATGDNRDFLFRSGTGLATMFLKGGYDKAGILCTDAALTFLKVSELAKTGFQTEHLYELQMVKQLLTTAVTGYLPSITGNVIMNAQKLTEAALLAGWNKAYSTAVTLNRFYEVVSGVPSTYTPPANTPADRIMTVLGDWGNMKNLLLVRGDINWVKGQLFSLHNPMGLTRLKACVAAALKGNVKKAKEIEKVVQNVFATFNYMNDAGAETVWRQAYDALNQEIKNMDQHMPELAGMKDIFDEFLPAYHQAVADKARQFVVMVNNYVTFTVPQSVANQSPHLGKMLWTCSQYARRVSELRWQDSSGLP